MECGLCLTPEVYWTNFEGSSDKFGRFEEDADDGRW
jgi:hypothetical protein